MQASQAKSGVNKVGASTAMPGLPSPDIAHLTRKQKKKPEFQEHIHTAPLGVNKKDEEKGNMLLVVNVCMW